MVSGQHSPKLLLIIDNTGFTGGDTYTSQQLGQSGEYESNIAAGGQTGAGPPGGVDIQSDRYTTPGGPDRATTGQTYADPRMAGAGGKQPDDEYSDELTGKPPMTSRAGYVIAVELVVCVGAN